MKSGCSVELKMVVIENWWRICKDFFLSFLVRYIENNARKLEQRLQMLRVWKLAQSVIANDQLTV